MESGKKFLVGNVIKLGSSKTVTISVERTVQCALYQKNIKEHSKFLVHDEKGICKVGDKVSVQECRPLSKRKHFFVVEVLNNTYDSSRV